jgi:hypothetical protein
MKKSKSKSKRKSKRKAVRPSSRRAIAPIMPYFAASLATRVGRAFALNHVCRQPEDVAFFRPESLPYWISDSIRRHMMMRLQQGWTGENETRTLPLQRWSVGVASTDLEGDVTVAVVLDIQATVKPITKILAALPHLARSAEKADSGDCDVAETCWLCLDEYGQEGEAQHVDFFCCGHPVCEACRTSVMTLTKCGMCRARKPMFDTLKAELVSEANEMRERFEGRAIKEKTRPEHDRDVAAEIDRIVRALYANGQK